MKKWFDEEQKRTTFSFIFHEEDLREVAAKLATTTQMMRAAHAMKRSVLGSLIAELDFFMSRFLALAAKLEPERFYDVNESVPLGKIVSAGSVNDYIESRIKSAVRDKLRDSHVDQIDWVVTTFGLAQDISKYRKSKIFREFVEVCQRRYVLTHNGGIVNGEYIKKCLDAGLDEADILPKDSKAEVSFKYMRRAAARVYLTGYFRINDVCPSRNFLIRSLQSFATCSRRHMTFWISENTKMANRVIEFAEYSKKDFDNDLKLKFGLHRALASLFAPDTPEEQQNKDALRILNLYDWSVTTPSL